MSKLFGEFKTPSISDWKKLAAKELKGVNIDELNLWQARDGFQAKPAYFRSEMEKLPMYGQTIRPLRFNQKNII